MAHKDTETGWLERRETVDAIVRVLWVMCVLIVLSQLFYTSHGHFAWASWFGAHAVFGFLAYCFVVFTAKGLRRFAARPENYYGDDEPLEQEPSRPDEH